MKNRWFYSVFDPNLKKTSGFTVFSLKTVEKPVVLLCFRSTLKKKQWFYCVFAQNCWKNIVFFPIFCSFLGSFFVVFQMFSTLCFSHSYIYTHFLSLFIVIYIICRFMCFLLVFLHSFIAFCVLFNPWFFHFLIFVQSFSLLLGDSYFFTLFCFLVYTNMCTYIHICIYIYIYACSFWFHNRLHVFLCFFSFFQLLLVFDISLQFFLVNPTPPLPVIRKMVIRNRDTRKT